MDWTTLTPWLTASLNAPTVADLDPWTESELYQYAEEALHAIGARYLLMAACDTSTALVANQPLYQLPADHIDTILAAVNGVVLETATVAEMEALDDDYKSAAPADPPTRWIANEVGLDFIRLYPPPLSGGGVLALIYQQHPPNMPVPAEGQPLEIKMPAPVGDYLAIQSLEQARRRQGDGQMLDAAQAFANLGSLYEKVFEAYWGSGE